MSTTDTTRSPWRYLALLALGLAGLGGDCGQDIVNDPTFRDWCGNTLCSWNLDSGNIARVPTWDANDFGVSFVETPTQISQATDESAPSSNDSAACILFTSVANVDPAAALTLEVDFDDDGTIDYVWAVPTSQWQRVQVEITAPAAYDGIRFILKKAGTGTAILAEMRVQGTTGCTAGVPITVPKLALGEPCTSNTDCSSGVCASGSVCLLGCTGPTTVCSECDYAAACPEGEQCTARAYASTLAAMPLQCSPGQSRGAKGAPCIGNDDCASGQCTGAAATAPQMSAAGGPPGACDLEAVLDPPQDNCTGYSVRGGTCN
jgi:hypothetical protein